MVTETEVPGGRQAPAGWLCVATIWLPGPSGAVNAPVKPAPFHVPRAFATVRPTRSGTVGRRASGSVSPQDSASAQGEGSEPSLRAAWASVSLPASRRSRCGASRPVVASRCGGRLAALPQGRWSAAAIGPVAVGSVGVSTVGLPSALGVGDAGPGRASDPRGATPANSSGRAHSPRHPPRTGSRGSTRTAPRRRPRRRCRREGHGSSIGHIARGGLATVAGGSVGTPAQAPGTSAHAAGSSAKGRRFLGPGSRFLLAPEGVGREHPGGERLGVRLRRGLPPRTRPRTPDSFRRPPTSTSDRRRGHTMGNGRARPAARSWRPRPTCRSVHRRAGAPRLGAWHPVRQDSRLPRYWGCVTSDGLDDPGTRRSRCLRATHLVWPTAAAEKPRPAPEGTGLEAVPVKESAETDASATRQGHLSRRLHRLP